GLRGRVVDADRLLDDAQLLLRQVQTAGDLLVRGRPAQLILELGGRAPPFGEQLNHVGGNANRLGSIDESPPDRLLDAVAGVGAEARVHRRVEALDRAQQAEVAFLNEVLQAEALTGVAASNIDDQTQVSAHHLVAGFTVAVLDAVGQALLLVGAEERCFVDLTEVGFQRRLDRITPYTARSCHGEPSSAKKEPRAGFQLVYFRVEPDAKSQIAGATRRRGKIPSPCPRPRTWIWPPDCPGRGIGRGTGKPGWKRAELCQRSVPRAGATCPAAKIPPPH